MFMAVVIVWATLKIITGIKEGSSETCNKILKSGQLHLATDINLSLLLLCGVHLNASLYRNYCAKVNTLVYYLGNTGQDTFLDGTICGDEVTGTEVFLFSFLYKQIR